MKRKICLWLALAAAIVFGWAGTASASPQSVV